jgi:putative flippase GtrA
MINFMIHFFNQFRRFATIGVFNTIVGTSLQFLGCHALGFSVENAGYIGYGLVSVLSYWLNRQWAFQSKKRHLETIVPFIMQSILSAIIFGKITGLLVTKLSYTVAISVGVATVFIVNFIIIRFIFVGKKLY